MRFLLPWLLLLPVPSAAENVVSVGAFGTSADTSLAGTVHAGFNFGHGMIYDFEESLLVEADSPSGVRLAWEYRSDRSLAFGLTVGWSSFDLPYTWDQVATPRFPELPQFSPISSTGTFSEVTVYPILLDLGRVWTFGSKSRLALGGTVAGFVADADVRVDDNTFGGGFNFLPFEENGTDQAGPVAFDVDNAVALGVVLGFDVELTPRVRPTLKVRWLDATLDVGAVGVDAGLDLGPWWFEVGLGWKL